MWPPSSNVFWLQAKFLLFLVCTLVPIVKENLDDIPISDNFRTIVIGSLILKWFDWLILILNSDKLTTDKLQFGFQKLASTTMCSWRINSIGRAVYACDLDLSKAFDLVSWEVLKYLQETKWSRKKEHFFSCNVQKCSNTFNVQNWVRQLCYSVYTLT